MPVREGICREAEISLHGGGSGIEQVTRQIFDKIEAHVPASLKVLTLATLQLRDIQDPENWASHIFPDAPVHCFNNDKVANKTYYESHIEQLKNQFPLAQIETRSSTVVGGLCEGIFGISMLEVNVTNETKVEFSEQHAKISIKETDLDGDYRAIWTKLYASFTGQHRKDFASFVTMLSILLRKWDVVVITANNIQRNGVEYKSGLAGAIFCFDRPSTDHAEFLANLPVFFSPILQLVANAALLESTYHYHQQSESLRRLLVNNVQPAMKMLEAVQHEIQDAIGGCFGEDLASLWADLQLKRQDGVDPLLTFLGLTLGSTELNAAGTHSGIFHLPYKFCTKFQEWLETVLPKRYLYLYDNPDFKHHFIDPIILIKSESEWNKLIRNTDRGNRLRNFFVGQENKSKIVFTPHIEKIKNAVKQDFSSPEKVDGVFENGVMTITVTNTCRTKNEATEYLKVAREKDVSAQFERMRHHPQAWLRLYKGKVTIEWKSGEANIAAINIDDIDKIPENLEWSDGDATSIVAKYYI
jgi:hypothetical protein